MNRRTIMEYWEFLLQQDGSRSWQPLKSKSLAIIPGRYRIVAHSSRTNADVEICVTHTSTEEVPPKRRSQKRSRRTNSEGLMVVIPFTYLKPGIWEIRCCGDIMSDFLGKSWQNQIQLQVLAPAQPSLPVAETSPEISQPTPTPELEISHQTTELELKPEIAVQNGKTIAEEPVPVTLVEVETLIPVNLEELEVETSTDSDQTDSATPSNPILEQSLQMLEQILQQVLDPVLEEFEESESESPSEPEEIEVSAGVSSIWQGLTLTLETDSLTAKRGEALTIAGVVDIVDLNSSNAIANQNFQGSLRYQLRDPQSSQLLLDVQHPLPTQALPLAFSHNLEIPECNTRLILGKVTLYDSTPPVALTSQPFTITADLDELLGSIIPGTKVMPVAKMLVLANNFTSLEDTEAMSELADVSLEPIVIDLIDTKKPPQRPLAPATQNSLPPQIYQPAPTPKGTKSLDLPNFPKLSVAKDTEIKNDQLKPEEPSNEVTSESLIETTEPVTSATSSQSLPLEEASQEEVGSHDGELPVLLVSLDDSPTDASEVMKEAATITSVSQTPEVDLELSDWDTPEEPPILEEPVVDEPGLLDNAFQALNTQDRFWLRLNSLATDAELSQWLQSDAAPNDQSAKVEEVNQGIIAEVEEVTKSENKELITDFDASIWDNSEEFGNSLTAEELEPEVMPPQLSKVGVGDSDWAIQEIVVDDDEPILVPELPQPKPQPMVEIKPTPEPVRVAKSQIVTPAPVKFETPLPAPKVFIPKKELAVGEPVVVRVKLPPHQSSPRLCVKLWLQDRQSRALLDGPRWLVDLLPDGTGNLEAMTQVVVPFGFDEIRFEAIAVDLDSQRESHKVTVDCVVMPPDLPDFSLDDFET